MIIAPMTAEALPPQETDAVRSDGGLVQLRLLTAQDRAAILALDDRCSDRSIYLRFFSVSRHTADSYVKRLLRPAALDHAALVASIGGQVVGVAGYELLDETVARAGLGGDAEFALLVDDQHQHLGIGTLLVEHLASLARQRGVARFIADVLAENRPMTGLLRELGFTLDSAYDAEMVRYVFGLELDDRAVAAIGGREGRADARSLRALLSPRSIAVIGAGEHPHSVGHEVLANIIAAGYTGDLYVVNPRRREVLGVASVPNVSELPATPDLAVIAVPAAAVLGVVRSCAERAVPSVLLLSAGFGETGVAGQIEQDEMVRVARGHGMRLVGPNCLGLVNTDPSVHLNATFGPIDMTAGAMALASQSGALGVAVLAAAARCGLGVAQFVSMGNKADVSGNDLLLAWEHDERISVIALYLESFGNPRRFARIAARVGQIKPIIAIKAGRSNAGQRAGQSHTAAAAASDVVVDALFTQAGVIRVDTIEQLLDVARILVQQPWPKGSRISIIGNSGGPGILAADAAQAAGLTVIDIAPSTQDRIRRIVSSAASTQNPIDLGSGVQPAQVGEAVRALLADGSVDVVLGVFTETLVADAALIIAAVAEAASGSVIPVICTQVGAVASARPVPGGARCIPIFTFPESAVAAIGLACRWGSRPPSAGVGRGVTPEVDRHQARRVVRDALEAGRDWLPPQDVARLLDCYGIRSCDQRVVTDVADAVHAAAVLGYPLAVKVATPGVHKTDVGGVRLGIRDESELRLAVDALGLSRVPSTSVLLQPMAEPGVELIAGALQDSRFGPLVMLGIGGTLADVIADRLFRLAPLSSGDALEMIRSLHTQRLLNGFRDQLPVSRTALADLMVRLAALVEDLPEAAELDLNPIVARGAELLVVDARVRVAPAVQRQESLLRELARPR
jgi:acyl-CoA synthetase (NDP forming)/GNAT superfamily N-acetyltransferase